MSNGHKARKTRNDKNRFKLFIKHKQHTNARITYLNENGNCDYPFVVNRLYQNNQ